MKINLLYSLLVCFSLFGCSDEDSPEPSYVDVNWFVVNHDPNADELDQLRYEIFTETGIPIFYTDTLGSQERTDRYGNNYTYYEVCNPNYIFTNNRDWEYALTRDRVQLLEMTEFIDDYVLPLMNLKANPRGILIVDTLLNTKKLSGMQIGMSMTMMSIHPKEGIRVSDMTKEEKLEHGMALAGTKVSDYLVNYCDDDMQRFYDVSEIACLPEMSSKDGTKGKSCYYRGMYKLIVPNTNPVEYITKECFAYGFLSFRGQGKIQYQTVTKETDIMDFMNRILNKTDAEIREEFREWDLIIEKYEIILEILKKNGLEAWIKGE